MSWVFLSACCQGIGYRGISAARRVTGADTRTMPSPLPNFTQHELTQRYWTKHLNHAQTGPNYA